MEWQSRLEELLRVRILNYHRKFSFRNRVFLVDTINRETVKSKYIIKEYVNGKADQETAIICNLRQKGLLVPRIIWSNSRVIIMEYIEGILLTDLLTNPKTIHQSWVNSLAKWLYHLHSTERQGEYCFCKSDLNLRNFIFTGDNFYGIDFEDICITHPERDLGGISSFILTNDPMFAQWKFKVCSSLVKAYVNVANTQLDYRLIEYYLLEELKATASRREKQRDYLLNKIKELNLKGNLIVFNN
ncbi:RIO1 family regulatory kinase/ATPase [Desulfofalx alkaliphila]|uniref:RIO1 family regulatory kinase/ATPase domain-containing protein n=1 Tax=Desulfofalx alkaliphila TaxID=105483 RepID=UPI0004E1BA66|nr:RIO1 family regulatory kinase/ATPase [Desulfofalx alkaliphila]